MGEVNETNRHDDITANIDLFYEVDAVLANATLARKSVSPFARLATISIMLLASVIDYLYERRRYIF